MERKIDETFTWNHDSKTVILKVTEARGCGECAFSEVGCSELRALRGECESSSRSDGKSVQFHKVPTDITTHPIGTIIDVPKLGAVVVINASGCDDCSLKNYNGTMCGKLDSMGLGECSGGRRSDRISVQFRLAPQSKPTPTTKFKVGDRVKIVHAGSGAGSNDLGRLTTIVEVGDYSGKTGYKIDPPYTTNSQSGMYNGMLGEVSFELVEAVPEVDPRTIPHPRAQFQIGDIVEVTNSGSGTYRSDIGKQSKIVRVGTYGSQPGYVLDPPHDTNSNPRSSAYEHYKGMVGESCLKQVKNCPPSRPVTTSSLDPFWSTPTRSSGEGVITELIRDQAIPRTERVSSQPLTVVPIFIAVPKI